MALHHHLLIILLSTLFLSPVSVHSLSSSPSPKSFGALLLEQNNGFIDSSSSSSNNHGWEYWCDSCSCGFNKRKSYHEHLSGKRHASVVAEESSLWEAYLQSGPTYYDPSVTRNDATRAWSLDLFMDGLQARSRSSVQSFLTTSTATSTGGAGHGGGGGGGRDGQIDPSLKFQSLPPSKKAALWRMMYTSNIPNIAQMVSVLPPQYVRVKELLESIEVFHQIQNLMKRSKVNGQKPKRIKHIYDVGCGHGLVGMLCAATFPDITVHGIDRVPRDSFLVQQQAFQTVGVDLKNLKFEAGDLSILENIRVGNDETDHNEVDDNHHSLLLCVHGCKSLTHESIELAIRNKWAWLSLPCCLQSENHLEDDVSLKVDDKTRFVMLCGVIAAKYNADSVSSIDSRITARGIVLASSL